MDEMPGTVILSKDVRKILVYLSWRLNSIQKYGELSPMTPWSGTLAWKNAEAVCMPQPQTPHVNITSCLGSGLIWSPIKS